MNKKIVTYIKTLSNNSNIQNLLIKTLGKILLKQNNINLFIKQNNEKITHIVDWTISVIENNERWTNPRVLTIEALNNAADKYFEKKNNNLKTIELNKKDEKLIADLGDYYIVQMLTPESLDNESKVMQHCIGYGAYDENLKDEDCQYLSLRDKFNKAHVTMEIFKKKIIQLQGKQNELPNKKYLEILVPWLIDNEYEKIPWKKFKKYYENGQWIDFKDITLKENIDYTLENYKNLSIKKNLSDKFYLSLKKEFFNFHKNNLIVNDNIMVEAKNDKDVDYICNIDKNKIFWEDENIKTLVSYLVENEYKNISWNNIGQYYENGQWTDLNDITLKENIDYNSENYKNINIKKNLSDKFYLYHHKNPHDINVTNNICINDKILVKIDSENNQDSKDNKKIEYIDYIYNENKKIIEEIKNTEKEEIIQNIILYLRNNNYENIPWYNLGKYYENNKLYNLENVELKENIDYNIIKYNSLIIKKGISEKFNISCYNFTSNTSNTNSDYPETFCYHYSISDFNIFNDTLIFCKKKLWYSCDIEIKDINKLKEIKDINLFIEDIEKYIKEEVFEFGFKNSLQQKLEKIGLFLDEKNNNISNISDIELEENIDYTIEKYKNLTIKYGKTEKFSKFYNQYSEYPKNIYIAINEKVFFAKDTNDIIIEKIISHNERKQIAEYIFQNNQKFGSPEYLHEMLNFFNYYVDKNNKLIKLNNVKLKQNIDYENISYEDLSIKKCISDKAIKYFLFKFHSIDNKKYEEFLNRYQNMEYFIIDNKIFIKKDPTYNKITIHIARKDIINIQYYEKIMKYLKDRRQIYYNVSNTDITEISNIPKNVTKININYCKQLNELPNNNKLKIIYARNSGINKLPEYTDTITLLNILYNKKIKELPNNLKLYYLNISGTKIKKIPDDIIANTCLIYNTNIKKIPEHIKNMHTLGIAFSKIEKLPDNLNCKIIYIDETQIHLINKTINFETLFIYKKNIKKFSYIKMHKIPFFEKVDKNEIETFLEKRLFY